MTRHDRKPFLCIAELYCGNRNRCIYPKNIQQRADQDLEFSAGKYVTLVWDERGRG